MKYLVSLVIALPLIAHLIIAYNPPQFVRLWAVDEDYAHYCFKENDTGVDTYFVWGENPFDKSDIPPCLN